MKKWKKILAASMAAALTVSSLAGCGKKESAKSGGEQEIEIAVWNAGLGTAWLDAMISAFEEKHPEYKVTYTATASVTAVTAGFRNEDSDTVDIYMAVKEYDTEYQEPLDDVLDSTVEGESKSLREKIDSAYLDLEKAEDGKVYELAFGGGSMSFVYNKKMFEEAGIRTIPRTTDELASACDALISADMTPICHFQTSGYWDFMNEVWFAQYEGMDYYKDTFYKNPSKETFTKEDGRYEVMKACEKIVTPDYVLPGSNSTDHVTMQTRFLNGEAAMMINGSWLANEMASIAGVDDFAIMKTPVISSITNKLETVKLETDLRKVIVAIDSVVDGETDIAQYQDGDNYKVDGLSVSAADWDYIRKARYTVANNFSGQSMFIPSYSDAKEGAKEFMKFIYSDEGCKIYSNVLHATLPVQLSEGTYDTKDWNAYELAMYNLTQQAEQVATEYIMSKDKIFWQGGARSFANYQFINKFCANNAVDRRNASQAWSEMVAQIENDYKNNWLANVK